MEGTLELRKITGVKKLDTYDSPSSEVKLAISGNLKIGHEEIPIKMDVKIPAHCRKAALADLQLFELGDECEVVMSGSGLLSEEDIAAKKKSKSAIPEWFTQDEQPESVF
jgi:hypothetical protein